MGYLYLNFLDNMQEGSKSCDDFYTTSLKEQFEVLSRKLGGYSTNIQEFLAYAFPTQTSKNYYISMPTFDRRVKQKRGREVINNIVIRPERDSYLNVVVPSNEKVSPAR